MTALAEPPVAAPVAGETAAPSAVSRSERLLSLDVFRGVTIAAMILVNNPGDWGAVFAPLLHAYWTGLTVATQDTADLLGSDVGKAVVANATTQILLRQAPQAVDEVTTSAGGLLPLRRSRALLWAALSSQ